MSGAQYQAWPNIGPDSLRRSGLMLMAATPPPVGGSAPKVPDKGWAKTLGLSSGKKIDDPTIKTILDYLEKEVRKQGDPTPGVFNPIYEQAVRDWRAATQKDLTERWKGKTLGTLPANPLEWGPNVKQGDIFKEGTLIGDSPVGQSLRSIQDITQLLTDTGFIVGILGVVGGLALIMIAYPHVLGDAA